MTHAPLPASPSARRGGRPRRSLALSSLALSIALAACSGGDSGGTTTEPPPPPPFGIPTNVQVTATSASAVHVTWTAVTGATAYVVQRIATGTAPVKTTVTGTSFDDSGLKSSTTYQYQVAAARATDTTLFSTAVSVTTRSIPGLLRGDITASRTLTADTIWTLSGFVKVRPGATLRIQPGTRILGDTTVPGSSLWILRGAKIDAQGTAANPIVFTSARATGSRAAGDWGGLVLIGNAPTSRATAGTVTYGPDATGQASENYGGGTVPNDDNGILRYVRIEFAGGAPTVGADQMAALTLYAVGRTTQIEYVQSLESLGSGFQWYGGTVDGRYLVSYEAGDDHFSWSEGYSGRNQFLLALQTHQPTGRAANGLPSTTPRGLQGYGCDVALTGCATYLNAPLSQPVFANFTVIGPGPNAYSTQVALQANGATLRRGTGGTLLAGVLARWAGVGLDVREAQTDTLRQRDSLTVASVLLTDNALGNFDPAQGGNFGLKASFPGAIDGTAATGSLFTALPAAGAIPTVAALDWTPATGSPLRTPPTAYSARVAARLTGFFGGTLGATTYLGAADPAGAKWWAGWTAYARN